MKAPAGKNAADDYVQELEWLEEEREEEEAEAQRVGRAGRFGRTGRSIALLTNQGDDVARAGLMHYYRQDEEGKPLELMTQTSLEQMQKEQEDAAGEED
jgi:superfamily II DNA/RNA helicase